VSRVNSLPAFWYRSLLHCGGFCGGPPATGIVAKICSALNCSSLRTASIASVELRVRLLPPSSRTRGVLGFRLGAVQRSGDGERRLSGSA